MSPVSPHAFTVTQPNGTVTVVYDPTPKQFEFHSCQQPNVVYIGSRGTGKSKALRMEAHQRSLAFPGFRYAILGLTHPDLLKNHLDFIDEEMMLFKGTYHKTDKVALYPNGSKGFYSHADDRGGLGNMLGAEVYWLGVDELCSLGWDTFRKVAASVRVPRKLGLTAMVRAATNPIGPSVDRVYEYFIDKNVEDDPGYIPGEWHGVRTKLRNADGSEDNPHIDVDQYLKGFSGLPAHVLKGWVDGERFSEDTYFFLTKAHYTDVAPVMHAYTDELGFVIPAPHIYRAIDWGTHDAAVCLWIAVYHTGRAIVFNERDWTHTTAKDVATEIRTASEGMRVIDSFCDPTMFPPPDAGLIGVGDIFERNRVPLTKSKNDRTACGYAISEWLNTILPDGLPKLQIYTPRCPMLTKTLPIMRIDPDHPGRIADGRDHWVIALGYWAMSDASAPRAVTPKSQRESWRRPPQKHKRLGSESVR